MKSRTSPPKKTVLRIVVNGKHEWVKADGKRKPFDCDYKGAIKKGYGMLRKEAATLVGELGKQAIREKISAVVIFFKDPSI